MNTRAASATTSRRSTLAAAAPYAVWMGLLFGLPATAANYAWRSVLTAAAAAVALRLCGTNWLRPWWRSAGRGLGWGIAAGLAVLALWVLPEFWPPYREFSLMGFLGLSSAANGPSPYDVAVCGWPLAIVRLCGSAFVIAPVEELFFRSFLYRYLQRSDWTQVPQSRFDAGAFVWMVALFALEHHTRIAAGAMAGAIYGLLAIREGVGAAVVAHICTNLLLGVMVLVTGRWDLW